MWHPCYSSGNSQCPWLRTSVRKWCMEFDFDVQNFHPLGHCDAWFLSSHWTESRTLVKRNKAELPDDSQSLSKSSFPLPGKQSVHAQSVLAACFQKVVSPRRVRKKWLKCLNVSCLWAFNSGSCLHLWELCTEFRSIIFWQSCSILCCMTMLFSDW